MTLWLVSIAGATVSLYLVWTFNRLVGLKNRANAAWSDIDVQLKRGFSGGGFGGGGGGAW